jgi:hypothetical protein
LAKKYLIIVQAPYLSAGSAMRGVVAQSAAASLIDEFQNRRLALIDVACAVLSSNAPAATPLANSAVVALTDLAVATASVTAGSAAAANKLPPGVEVLEGLGALIVDDSQFDPLRLQSVAGLEVFEDATVELPTPVTVTPSAAAASPWHLNHIRGHGPLPGNGAGILVGVLDTGIDATHGEFAGRSIHFAEYDSAGTWVSSTPRDASHHGTHVCSLIAGTTFGVAPHADLAVASVLTTPNASGVMTGTTVQISYGLNWLLTQTFPGRTQPGVDVINASLAGVGYNGYLRTALTGALAYPGILLVAAIGNSGRAGMNRHGSPGNYPEVLGIGAVDSTSTVADFSDWGVSTAPPPPPAAAKPDLSAPGVNVPGALPHGATGLLSGTSMAAPLVTGFAATLLGANPTWIGAPSVLRSSIEARARSNAIYPHPTGHNQGGIGQI